MDGAPQSGLTAADSGKYLDIWEELSGRIYRIKEVDGKLLLELSTSTISFPVGSLEAEVLREHVLVQEGSFISILRTDSETNPIRITVQDSENFISISGDGSK